ncbi:MAG: GNAT family N-acetyltransferase [Microbacter sp.]
MKALYRQLCEREPIPIFQQAWWMDAVCVRGVWDVFLYEEHGKVLAAMPFHVRKWFGFKFIVEPQLTPFTGIWINPQGVGSFRNRFQMESRAYSYLIDQLEQYRFDFYLQTFHPSVNNWLPFYWKGFRQQTRYSFIIQNISHPQKVFEAFSERKRRDIRKASSSLKVSWDWSSAKFYDFHKKTLLQRRLKISYSFDLFERITQATLTRHQGLILSASDEKNIHAALFVVWDEMSAYCLVYAMDEQFKHSGALSLLIWEAVQYLSDKTRSFDMEGSMKESVAASYSQFADCQLPYCELYKAKFWIDFLWQWKKKR